MEKEVLHKSWQKFPNITESSNIALQWSIFIDFHLRCWLNFFANHSLLYTSFSPLGNKRDESSYFKDLFPAFKLEYSKIHIYDFTFHLVCFKLTGGIDI